MNPPASTYTSLPSSSSTTSLLPSSSSTSLTDFRAREEALRKLDAELTSKKNEVVRRAEELVRVQNERMQRQQMQQLSHNEVPQPGSTSYEQHTFHSGDQGFLDETTGYRGRIETTAPTTRGTRGSSSAATSATNQQQPQISTFGTRSSNIAAANAQAASSSSSSSSYPNRPVSAATQSGSRRMSGIPTGGAAATSSGASTSSAASRVSSASTSRITPSSLSATPATATRASRPQSGVRHGSSSASLSRQPSAYSTQREDDTRDFRSNIGSNDYNDDADNNNNIDDAPSSSYPYPHNTDSTSTGLIMDDTPLIENTDYSGTNTGGGATGDFDPADPSAGSMGTAATIRFQKARITALTTSITTLTTSLQEREKELLDLKQLVKSSNDGREKVMRTKEAQDKQLTVVTKVKDELEARVSVLENENTQLRREKQQWEKKQKELDQEGKQKEAKYNRTLVELERVKELAAQRRGGAAANGAGGGSSDDLQKDLQSLRLTNKKLLQQRHDLLSGFKKQQKLIEILRKQKVHMELAKCLAFTEEEFAKSLEMGEI